jgi:glycosyltransferase involved in cell wall biosynthesis
MAQQKYFHVPNGINAAEWKQATAPLPEAHVRSILRARDRQHFLVGYAGYHGTANALEVLLDAAEHVRERPVTFLLVGKGPLKAQLVSLAAERGLANVEFLPPIEKSSIPALLAAMDALFIGWRNSPLYRFGVSPNKLFDYMMAQRPVIHSVTTTDDVVANAGCGISCAAEDPQGIADAITFLSSQSQSSLRAMGERGRQYVLDHHEYSVLAQDFLKAVA